MCFDDLVDKDGALRREAETTAAATATEPQAEEAGLRHRITESKAAALGSTFANPFADETYFDQQGKVFLDEAPVSRSSTPRLPMSPPVPPKPAAYQPNRLIDTEDSSHHPSEQIVDLTPMTLPSTAANELAELDRGDHHQSQSSYLSVNEWAQNQSKQSILFLPQPEKASSNSSRSGTAEGSVMTDSAEHASHAGTEDVDVMSEFDEVINTPSTWTEVGSQYSED